VGSSLTYKLATLSGTGALKVKHMYTIFQLKKLYPQISAVAGAETLFKPGPEHLLHTHCLPFERRLSSRQLFSPVT
jgi:hypothetical protein